MSRYITRTLEPILQTVITEFPVVVLTGPRQSGKTTVLKHLFGKQFRYVSMEFPDVRSAAVADPRGFMKLWEPPVIIDEIQFAPSLLLYIKEAVDAQRNNPGQFILTGSQNFLLMQQVTESLAGRAAILHLLPLTLNETQDIPTIQFPWEGIHSMPQRVLSYIEFWQLVLRGGFPELAINPARNTKLWQASYLQTYLERDVRLLRQIGDLSQFQVFLKLLATRSAQLLNLSEIARELGLSVNTIKAWLSILEASYQVIIVRPYFANISKRLIKMPKVYFLDTGLLCYLTGLDAPNQLLAGPFGGHVFETFVVSELFKAFLHRGEIPHLYFWRTSTGSEVDILVEYQQQLIAIEVKLSATPHIRMAAPILELQTLLGSKIKAGFVVHPGDHFLPLGENVTALPIQKLL